MNREILFRGKRDGDGEWVMGDRAGYSDYVMIWDLIDKGVGYLVDPATVGQFTGLVNKNGVKIFEGNILYKEGHWTFYVGYEMGAFRAIPLEPVQKLNWPHCTLEEFLRVGMGDCKGFKVIGNIHDNPELLKQVEE